jgi:glycosyltransferase involved in cell wall biosynthesis
VNVLYLTAEFPYPLSSGHLRHFHFLRGLARRHAITHMTLTRRAAVEPGDRAALAPYVVGQRVFGEGGGSGGAVRRRVHVARAARELRGAVAEHLASGATDVVVLCGKETHPALPAVDGVGLVVDICDAGSVRLRGELAVAAPRRRPALALRLAERRRIERALAARTPHLLFASERDRAALGAAHGVVVANGVDLDAWSRRAAPAGEPLVAFTGVMSYRPNHDAALRLVERVMPRVRARVPGATAVVAGRDPLPALRAAAGPGAAVTGALLDLRPELERAAVYCAPLRFASGIQNKLLEALAMEVPVVTTDVAAAGLRAAGEEPPLVVADGDDELAAAVAALLVDPAARARLAAAGRAYVERHFSWARSVAVLDEALRAAAAAHGRPAARPARRRPATTAVPRP